MELNETESFPSEPFVLANDWLVKIYPEEDSMDPALKKIVQRLFLLIERIVVASPVSCCPSVVLSMSEALCLWVKDSNEVLSDTEYNETVRSRQPNPEVAVLTIS